MNTNYHLALSINGTDITGIEETHTIATVKWSDTGN